VPRVEAVDDVDATGDISRREGSDHGDRQKVP
jgi:hypothetical protein